MLRRSSVAAAFLAAAVSTLALLAAPTIAAAGTYTFSQDTSKDVSGWRFTRDPGYAGCSLVARSGVCDDGDVPLDTPLRIFGTGKAAAGSSGFWEFVAPPTTSFASGQVSLSFTTKAGTTYAFFQQRLRSQGYSSVRSHTSYGNSAGTSWPVSAGEEAFAVHLANDQGDDFAQKWNNTLAVTSLSGTLRDDTAPSLTLAGPLADGLWHAEHQPVCVDVHAADAGSGVAVATLSDQTGALLDRHSVALANGPQPGAGSYSGSLCVTPSALADGVHPLTLSVRDAAGEVAASSFDLRVDAHAPQALDVRPASTTTDRRPAVSFAVDAGPSGLAELDASFDGQPMLVDGAAASYQPAADLPFGEHTVVWHAADEAGNSRDGFWSFRVVDATPPTLSAPAPADGWQGEERRPLLSFNLADEGTGVDPSTLRVLLDGVDVAAIGALSDGRFAYAPAPDLAFGQHRVRVVVADRAGNVMAAADWSFQVVDRTPPLLADPRPDDGSSGSDRTPVISLHAADDGIGLDAGGVAIELDGGAVAAQPLGDGRFGFTPQTPLSLGEHVVSARASDRSGNVSAELRWSFSVRDEVAPMLSLRRPEPGSTVAGASEIGFTLSDAGSGVDPASLHVEVDGSDVTGWGSYAGGSFHYAPGAMSAGVHTVTVTVSDRDGNVAGPISWQFQVADPVTLSLHRSGGAGSLVAGRRTTLRFVARAGALPLAGEEVRVASEPAGRHSFGRERVLRTSAAGVIAWRVEPHTTTRYRVRLAAHTGVSAEARVVVHFALRLHAGRSRLAAGSPLRLSGRLSPARARRVAVQLLTRRGWATVARPHVSRRGLFAATVLPRVRGRYLFRAVAAGDRQNARGQSAAVAVRVR